MASVANPTSLRRLAAPLFLGALLAACSSEQAAEPCTDPPPANGVAPTTDFVTHLREWQPGERAAYIASVKASGALVIPYVGDISDDAEQLFDMTCTTEIIPNPALNPASPSPDSPFGPLFSVQHTMVPGTGWTSSTVDVHIVNTRQGNDTFDWQLVFWVNNAEQTWKGYAIAANAAATMAARTVNTTTFDTTNAKTGAAAAEARASTSTYWQANGTGAPNQFSISASSTSGTPTTFTSGPFLGGTRVNLSMTFNINNVGLTRVLGSGSPATQTASLSGTIAGGAYNCIFPSPCTTNVPNLAAVARTRALTGAEYAQLPWITAMPETARLGALRAYALRRAAVQR